MSGMFPALSNRQPAVQNVVSLRICLSNPMASELYGISTECVSCAGRAMHEELAKEVRHAEYFRFPLAYFGRYIHITTTKSFNELERGKCKIHALVSALSRGFFSSPLPYLRAATHDKNAEVAKSNARIQQRIRM
jgi:hypothetical protein